MGLFRVPCGKDIREDFNVVIEIPAHSEPIKYEVCKETGAMFVDRFLSTPMRYPCDYGYIPQTLSDDGDPVDVLVISPIPAITGSVIRCRPLGMLKMSDEAGMDAKLLAVPVSKLTPVYNDIKGISDLPPLLLKQIAHFFEHYKDLEENKWVKIEGWGDKEEAVNEILSSVERYNKENQK